MCPFEDRLPDAAGRHLRGGSRPAHGVSVSPSGENVTHRDLNRDRGEARVGVNVGYARCSTTRQDLTAQREQLTAFTAGRTVGAG